MKILHVTPFFYPAWAYGGIPRLSFHLAQAQVELGHTVHCVTTDVLDQATRQPQRSFEIDGIQVRAYANLSNAAAYHLQFFSPWRVRPEIERVRDYDVVHIHGHRNLLCSVMAYAAREACVPQVLVPNGTLVNIERRQTLKWLYDILLGQGQVKNTTAFVAVSEAERQQFLSLGIADEKITVIPNGVSMEPDTGGIDFAERFGIQGPYLLYLGKITPRKGIEYLVRALPFVADKSLKLVIAGNDMGYLKQVLRITRSTGVSERVICTGLVSGELKAAAYAGARYTAYVSEDEIFGLVPWESMLCGTPVIVASGCGSGEWVGRARAGHVVPYADPAAVAEVINNYDAESEALNIDRGLKFIQEHLTWESVARQVLALYQGPGLAYNKV